MSTRSATLPRTAAALSACILALSACAYRDINPEAAAADERANNGYESLKNITPGKAKIVFRSGGKGHGVNYATSSDTRPCEGFAPVGNVAYSGRGVVLPWIARMNERTRAAVFKVQPFIEMDATPGQSVQVRGYSSYLDGDGKFTMQGRCGPLVSRFTPATGRAYTVEFLWGNNVCTQVVSDATNSDTPVPLTTEKISGCPAP